MKGQVAVLVTAGSPSQGAASMGSLIALSPLEVSAAIYEAASADIELDSDEDTDDIVLLLTGLAAKELVDTGSRYAMSHCKHC